MPPATEIEAALRERLQATEVVRCPPQRHAPRCALRAASRWRAHGLVRALTPTLARSRHPPQTVVDTSDGCGSKFEVEVVSPLFEGKALLARHRLVRARGQR
jgi:hypothetical protein